MASIEIHSIQSVSGNQPRIRRIIELAAQTFKNGTPVELDSSTGAIKAWDGTTVANGIAGFCKTYASNLATTGVPQQPSSGQVPNQPDALNILRPVFNDGRVDLEVADQDTVFLAQVGPAQEALQSDVGKSYGLTIDSDGHWYVDKTVTGADAVVTVVKLDPNDQSASPRGVYVVVLASAAQLVA